jgi:ribosomal protein S17
VSAFCGIHQSFRRARFGDSYQQIACRSGDKVSIAEQDILSQDEAQRIMETNACVYAK